MGTKLHPGENDCYSKAAPDEPIFTLRAHDKDAPLLVRIWALNREQAVEMGAKPPSDLRAVAEARQCAYEMERWRRSNGELDEQGKLGV